MRSWVEEWEDWSSRHPGEPRRQCFGSGFEIGATTVRRELSDEFDQLKAAVLELQNQLVETGDAKAKAEDVQYDADTLRAELLRTEQRAIAAESDANANRQERERLEAHVRELESDRRTRDDLVRDYDFEKRLTLLSESATRMLRERIERAIGVLEGQSFLGRRIERALEVLRGS